MINKLMVVDYKVKQGFIISLLRSLFSSTSFEMKDGEEAARLIENQKPDWVLVDVISPVNGELMSTLRNQDDKHRLRVTILNLNSIQFSLRFSKKHKTINTQASQKL